ncbi:MAG TPA: imidazolonepropionase [Anaerolineales bacterium]|nr:imidazolonepropionase [Anaerolineales bacterium]
MKPKADLILKDPNETLTCIPGPGDLIGRLHGASVATRGKHILDVAPYTVLVERYDLSETQIIEVTGKVLSPGFVDSHTHVVFGGSRVKEYAAKMTRTPAEVRAMGIPSGITASMTMTRAASEGELLESAADRLRRMFRAGTTTVESKSGYGLNLEHELKMLRVNQHLKLAADSSGSLLPDIVSTFLGAHAFPPDKVPEAYVDEIIHEMIPAVVAENLAEFCDVYMDEGYFNLDQTRRVLLAAQDTGLKLKIHADQYSKLGGSDLAAELGVVSADHLNYTIPKTMRKLADAGVVGVLMPLIDFAVQHPHPFDARAMLEAGMTLALATDMCPGGWTESMQLVMQFACRQHKLSPEEALYAATVGGARALDLHDRGALIPGLLADIQIWDVPVFEEVIYRLGSNMVEGVVVRGKLTGSRGAGGV